MVKVGKSNYGAEIEMWAVEGNNAEEKTQIEGSVGVITTSGGVPHPARYRTRPLCGVSQSTTTYMYSRCGE
jgi:hypothetical protein